MSKTKILLIQTVVCIVLGTVLGMAFWLYDGGKTCKKVSACPGEVSNEQETVSVKIYQGRWQKNFLEVIK